MNFDFIRDLFAQFRPVTVKRMFSGAGLYCDGVMFALVARDMIYLKADETSIADFKREGSGPFTYTRGKKSGRLSERACPIGDCRTGSMTIPTSLQCGRNARSLSHSGRNSRRANQRERNGNQKREASQKTLRVDVDLELDRAAFLWCLTEPAAQISGEVVIARRFEQQTKPMTAAHQSERCLGGTEHAHAMRRVLVERRGTR